MQTWFLDRPRALRPPGPGAASRGATGQKASSTQTLPESTVPSWTPSRTAKSFAIQ